MNNNIKNLDEISKLVMNKKLKRLYLLNNPISQLENYKYFVIAKIPQLKTLDFEKIKQKDRLKAKELFGESSDIDITKYIDSLSRKEKIKLLIEKTSSLEEINRLELLLKSGNLDDEILKQKLLEIN